MWIYLPLLVCLVGGVVYLVTQSAKWGELGRLGFAVGLFVFLLEQGSRMVGGGR